MDKKNALIGEVAENMLASPDLIGVEWDALALVMKFADGARGSTGFMYVGEKFHPWLPESFDSVFKMHEVRDLMREEEGREWHQALIHIVKKDMSIDIQFEYDEPRRWSLKAASLDMSDYANSLRPTN